MTADDTAEETRRRRDMDRAMARFLASEPTTEVEAAHREPGDPLLVPTPSARPTEHVQRNADRLLQLSMNSARNALRTAFGIGVVMCLVGGLVIGANWPDTEIISGRSYETGSPGGVGVGAGIVFAGNCLILVAVVGWGVRLGTLAAGLGRPAGHVTSSRLDRRPEAASESLHSRPHNAESVPDPPDLF